MPALDSLYGKLVKLPPIGANPDFEPRQSIVRRTWHGERSSSEIVIVIPPWHANESVHHAALKRLAKTGSQVLSYVLHDNILSADTEKTVDCFDFMADEIADDVQKSKINGADRVRFAAFSLGCTILTSALGQHGLSGRVSLVDPGGDLAASLWSGSRTQHLRESFEQQTIDLPKLQELWQHLSPTYQAARHIRNSSFRLYSSVADTVIRPDTFPPFVEALEAGGNQVEHHTNRHLGHYGTIVRHALFNRNL